ncbi:MAG: PAS domain S-box protein [Betaproteobacteria bacterium]|nr:PAS domain S-box protein [Betaproteobacteria bacterium]MDH5219738.1 PAS domain S-box protein [Betaproteobacteria bacterium]MDH5350485.1 PAS domain S-box protein [Betaproteobacteria bacterium]
MRAVSAEVYGALFDTAPDAILVIEGDGRIVLANAQAERMFGIPRGELLGLQIEALVPERLREAHAARREAYARAPQARHMGAGPPLYALRRDGTEFPVEIALGPVRDGGRELFAASVRDVSDLKRTRDAVRRGRYSSFVAQFGLRALAQPDVATLIDAACPLVAEAMQLDAAIAFRLSADRRELRCVASHGVSAAAAARMRAPNDPGFLPGYLVAVREPVVVPDTHAETRFGIIEVVRELGLRGALCVPLFGRGEVIGGLTARSRAPRAWTEDDVHFMQAVANIVAAAIERAATEETLLHAQRLEALGQLTGGVAHDFNNLLMVITGNLQILEDLAADRPQALALARQAMGAAERGALLTRKLLAFARRQPLHPRPLDLNHLVLEFCDLARRTLGENVSVHEDLDALLPPVVADAAELETALLNLAVNARDAMPGGGTLTLSTRRARVAPGKRTSDADLEPGNYAVVAVGDTGTGMSPGVAARAIEPFFTTKEIGKGSGLGLSMVYGFARQSGGTVRLESEPGAGTTVRLYLPLPADAAQPDVAGPGSPVPVGSEAVLVVEDQGPVREIAAGFLSHLGYRVHQAADAEAALRVLRTEPDIDLLFTDLALPGMDGVALAQQARALRPALRVLYTTGYASGSMLARLPEAERGAVLAKPYRREELAFLVRRALAGRRPLPN